MARNPLDELLVTLDVAVEAFAICEVKKGFRLTTRPANAVEVHYVLAGAMHMTVQGREPIVCRPGCVVVVPPGAAHSIAPSDGPAVDLVARDHCTMGRDGMLLVDAAAGEVGDLRVACGLIMASACGSFGLFDELTGPLAEDVADVEFVRQAFSIMLSEVSRPQLGTRALLGSLMKACLVVVLRRFLLGSPTTAHLLGNARDPRLTTSVVAILDKPAAPHTVASLAGTAGMSRSAFARGFGASFDMSPMEFVAKTRLHHAALLLRSSVVSVKTIAASVGFSSRSHFSRAFHDAYGSDPRNYRKAAAVPELDAPKALRGSREHFALQAEPD
jgi:AraC family transcriptional activator of mtrCDE